MHELLQKIRIGISLGFRFPLAAWRYVRCAHMELQFVRNLGASCRPCVFPVTSRFATGTPALPRYAPRSVTMRGGPSPSVVKSRLLGSLGPKALQSGVRTSRRGPSGAIDPFSSWAPSWLQVRIFSQFVCIFFARCLEVAFFIVS